MGGGLHLSLGRYTLHVVGCYNPFIRFGLGNSASRQQSTVNLLEGSIAA